MIRIKPITEFREGKFVVKLISTYKSKECVVERIYDLPSREISSSYLYFLVNMTIDTSVEEIKRKLNVHNQGVLVV